MTPEDQGSLDALLGADEAPMRRELNRQISVLERNLNQLRREVAPNDPLPESPAREAAILPAEQLEVVRDDLLERLSDLQHRVAQRFAAGIYAPPPVAPPPEPAPWKARLRRRFGR
jgi:hypothetical protein